MRRLSMPLLLLILLVVPLAVCAQVYKWTDAHGTVHFSDTPPPHGVHYKRVKTAAMAAAAPDAGTSDDTSASSRASNDAESGDSDSSSGHNSERDRMCANLKANLKLLHQDRPIITKGENGKQQVMTKDQRAHEMTTEQKQYQQFCH